MRYESEIHARRTVDYLSLSVFRKIRARLTEMRRYRIKVNFKGEWYCMGCTHVGLFVLEKEDGMGIVYYVLEITSKQNRMKEQKNDITGRRWES